MSIELKVPNVGESIQEVQIGTWLKHEGDRVALDESIVELDTDKASMELPAPADGTIVRILKREGESVAVGDVIAYIDESKVEQRGTAATRDVKPTKSTAAAPSAEVAASSLTDRAAVSDAQAGGVGPVRADSREAAAGHQETQPPRPPFEEEPAAAPSVRRLLREHNLHADDVRPTGEGGRVLREDVMRYLEERAQRGDSGRPASIVPPLTALPQMPAGPPESGPLSGPRASGPPPGPAANEPADGRKVVPMSLVRRRIAARLVEASQNAALLTTFNEIDMTAVMTVRAAYRDAFQKTHGVKLGLMPFFIRATVDALRQVAIVNAEVRGTDIVYYHAYHIGVAIGASRGLIVPVLRHADRMTFAEIERAIGDFSRRADENTIEPAELAGGTFTISNGGIYGSLLSTPIVNPPQSGVLGMHTIQDRPVSRDGQVVIRPMMYVALTYDHRIVDGREAVTFLKRVKEAVEDPARMLIGI